MEATRLSGEGNVLSPDWVEYIQNVGLVGKAPRVYVDVVDETPTEGIKQKREGKNKK